MAIPILNTKFLILLSRLELVHRPRLIEKLYEDLHRIMTLSSDPAGFGKTSLITEWLYKLRVDDKNETQAENKIAWISLDEGDNDPARFRSYFIAVLNQIEGIYTTFRTRALSMLQSRILDALRMSGGPLFRKIR